MAQKSDKQLVQSGYTPLIWDTPINIRPNTPTTTIKWLAARDIATYGDYRSPPPLTQQTEQEQEETHTWLIHHYLSKTSLPQTIRSTLTEHLQDIENNINNITLSNQIHTQDRIKLRKGQVWFSGDHPKSAYEILGKASEHTDPQYHWKEWKIYYQPKSGTAKNTKLWPQNSQNRGAGSTLIASWDEIFPEYEPERLIYHMAKGGEMIIDRVTRDEPQVDVKPRVQLPPKWTANLIILIAQHFNIDTTAIDQSNPHPRQLGQLCEEIRTLDLMIFTDGSQKKHKPKLTEIFYPLTPQEINNAAPANASVVLMDPTLTRENQEILAIHLSDINHEGHCSAYDGEFLAINLAQYINRVLTASWPIKTDCQAAVKIITQTQNHVKPTSPGNNHHYTLYSTAPGPKANYTIEHIPGHPEKRKPNREHWDYLDYGNFIADLAAKGNFERLEKQAPNSTIIHLKYTDIANDIMPIGEWTIRPKSNIPMSFKSILSDHYHGMHTEYIRRRDEHYRRQRNLPPKWKNSTFLQAGRTWKRLAHTISARAKATKHIYDWTWTGQNQAKGDHSGSSHTCKLCDQPDTQYHLFNECNHPILQTIRHSIMHNLKTTTEEITDKTNHSLANIAQTFTRLITNPPEDENWRPERLWTGLWTETQVQHFLNQSDLNKIHIRKPPTLIQIKTYQQTLQTLTIILADGIRQLFSARTQLIYTNNKHITIQPSPIKPIKKPKLKTRGTNVTPTTTTETHIRDIKPQLLDKEMEFTINRDHNNSHPIPHNITTTQHELNYHPRNQPTPTQNRFDQLTTDSTEYQAWEESKTTQEPQSTEETPTYLNIPPLVRPNFQQKRLFTSNSSKQEPTKKKSKRTPTNQHVQPPNKQTLSETLKHQHHSNEVKHQGPTPSSNIHIIEDTFQKARHKRKLQTTQIMTTNAESLTSTTDSPSTTALDPPNKKQKFKDQLTNHPSTSKSSSLSKDDIT